VSTTTTIIVALVAGYGGAALFRWWHLRHDADVAARARKLERVAWAARRALAYRRVEDLDAVDAELADALAELEGLPR